MAAASDSPASVSWRQQRFVLYVFCIQQFLSGIEYGIVLPGLWAFLQHNGVEQRFFLGVTLSAFSLANLLTSPIYGYLADHGFRTKTLLLVSNVFEVAGNLVYLGANDGYTILEARLIAGLGAGSGSAIFRHLAHMSTVSERTQLMGTVMMARQFGLLVGPACNLAFGGQTSFYMAGLHVTALNVPGLLMAVLWCLGSLNICMCFQDEGSELERDYSATEVQPLLLNGDQWPKTNTGSSARPSVLGTLLSAPMLCLFFAQFLLLFNQTCLETVLTPLTQRYFDFHARENSIMYMLIAVVVIAAFVVTKALSRWGCSDRLLIVLGILLQLAGQVILLMFFGIWTPAVGAKPTAALYTQFTAGSASILAGLPLVGVASPSLLSKFVQDPNQHGITQGVRRAVVSAATILGPLWGGATERMTLMSAVVVGLSLAALVTTLAAYARLLPPATS